MISWHKICKTFALIMLLAWQIVALPAYSCATCGCSEVCPLTMVDVEVGGGTKASILSNSIWGNMILKMAYAKDPELQKLAKKSNLSNDCTTGIFAGVAAGTIGQNIVSMSELNPPVGLEDSYVPGAIGLGLSGITNAAIAARLLLHHDYRKRMRIRKIAIREHVEAILQHLEYSKTSCPDAQKELVSIIGERAAQDCIQLWQSSHTLASASNEIETASNDAAIKPVNEVHTIGFEPTGSPAR
jgi:hypothetical protein